MKALPPVISYHGGVDGLQATATAAATEEEEEEEEGEEEAEEEEESVELGNDRSRRGDAGDYDYRDYYGDYRDSDSSDDVLSPPPPDSSSLPPPSRFPPRLNLPSRLSTSPLPRLSPARGSEGELLHPTSTSALFPPLPPPPPPSLFPPSVAAGNAGVKVNYATLGSLSGVAPRARIAVYKVIWGGMSSLADVMAAVEDAVKDGVDVLSLAVGGTDDNYFNSIFLLRAVQVGGWGKQGEGGAQYKKGGLAGCSAEGGERGEGGAGGEEGRMGVGEVGNATDREWSATLTLGNGTVLFGLTQTGGDGVLTANLPLIDSEEAHAKGAALWEARQCRPGKIDAEKVGSGLVLCYIGGISPEKKARTVQDAGARGMVLIPRNSNESVRSVSGTFPDRLTVPAGHTGPYPPSPTTS
ncbi:unnamed protein product [Closterium sp. Naga37s-1]|nr:unnamed protein product [Closterium sp. Naga37s-1]